MDLNTLTAALTSTQTPLLPDLAVLRVARAVSWALVLAFATVWLAQRGSRRYSATQVARYPWALPLLVALWTLIPGPWSPAYWLGLAFQMPSLSSSLLCAVGLWRGWRVAPPATAVSVGGADSVDRGTRWAIVSGVGLGWLLLLDTFAVLPFSLYSWGFSPATLALVALWVMLPWVLWGARDSTVLLSAALLLHVLLRLPTGNVWDALLDPWLWLILQLSWLRVGYRKFRATPLLPTTRA